MGRQTLHLTKQHSCEVAKEIEVRALLHLETKDFIASLIRVLPRVDKHGEGNERRDKFSDLVP